MEAVQEQATLREEFASLMRVRFLAGKDKGVDYAAIDADATLDDAFLGEMERDVEEAWFDGE